MYNMEKDKLSRRHHKNPSFSSTLLDEIYRSIDGYDQRREDFNLPKLETRKQSSTNIGQKPKKKSIEDEEIASFRRACLIEKWMDKKVKDKVGRGPSHELDNDSIFFSSTSSESNSGTLSASSSEPDYSFYSEKSSSSSTTCFAAPRTKSVRRASVSPPRPTQLYSFDNQQAETNLIKSKSRALKMYNNLKKVKQPISPGGRLTSFLTSIFNNKSKNPKHPNGGFHEVDDRNSKSSTCSSFSRSCLSKTPPKFSENGVKRTVRFNPVSVIVDEDCRPCGHKSIYDQDSDDLRRPKSQRNNAEKNRKFEVSKVDSLKSYKNDHINVDYADEDDDDASSCSSSDLFEIDHLAFFGNKRFCEELPVYETTHVDTNRGMASGFIR